MFRHERDYTLPTLTASTSRKTFAPTTRIAREIVNRSQPNVPFRVRRGGVEGGGGKHVVYLFIYKQINKCTSVSRDLIPLVGLSRLPDARPMVIHVSRPPP